MNIKTTCIVISLLICSASITYGQESSLSCDEHPNLTNAFLEAFNEIINIEQEGSFLGGSHQETVEGAMQETVEGAMQETVEGAMQETVEGAMQETVEGTIGASNFKKHVEYLAPIVWHCSKDAREYNEIVITALAIYSDNSTPHSVKEYVLHFLGALSQEYQNSKLARADQNVLTRSTSYFSKASAPALFILWLAQTSVFKRFVIGGQAVTSLANHLMRLSTRNKFAIFVGTPIAAGSGLEAAEWLEDILDGPRFDPATLIDYTLLLEMRNLAISACDLTEDLKQQNFDQNNLESLEGFNLRYQSLSKTYKMLSIFRPGYYITQSSNPYHLTDDIESAKSMDERLEPLFKSWTAIESNHRICNNMVNMSLSITGGHLQEIQQRLNKDSAIIPSL